MKNKDNKFKLIIRNLIISFILYSMYVVVFPPKDALYDGFNIDVESGDLVC